jgi:hypothetical protein
MHVIKYTDIPFHCQGKAEKNHFSRKKMGKYLPGKKGVKRLENTAALPS